MVRLVDHEISGKVGALALGLLIGAFKTMNKIVENYFAIRIITDKNNNVK